MDSSNDHILHHFGSFVYNFRLFLKTKEIKFIKKQLNNVESSSKGQAESNQKCS